ncbi:hypothetical protein KQX54_017266 [Cotesia glomerata]|uniref:Uncharacterized protein n=1 Tax=Cotesia glomerata TaxID=32391 RepID=A0AAV7I8V6_COTGL|nr:hypothetical protein KQX54_017266 [Cotesia glomerata]
MSLIQFNEEKITMEKLKSSIESLLNAHIVIGSISADILLIILFLIIREKCCVRKTVELDYSQFGVQAIPDGKEAEGLSLAGDFEKWFRQKSLEAITDDRSLNDFLSKSTTFTLNNSFSDEGSGQDDSFTDDYGSGLPASTSEDDFSEVISPLLVTTTEDFTFQEPASTSVVIKDASEKSRNAGQHSPWVLVLKETKYLELNKLQTVCVTSISAVVVLTSLIQDACTANSYRVFTEATHARMTPTYTYLPVVVLLDPRKSIKDEIEQMEYQSIFDDGSMIVNKTVIILCITILDAAYRFEYPSTPRPVQLLTLGSPLLHLDPVSHPTSKKSTPLPSSTTKDHSAYELSKSSRSIKNQFIFKNLILSLVPPHKEVIILEKTEPPVLMILFQII